MYKLHLTVGAALIGLFLGFQSCNAAVVLFDDFDSETHTLNWPGDSVFTSIPAPGNVNGLPSTDLIGTIPNDFFPLCQGHGNCVDLDGSTGSGNDPGGHLVSNASFSAGTYTLSFLLGGNQRNAPAQTTEISLADFLVSIVLSSADPLQLFTYTFTTTTTGVLSFLEKGPSNQQGNLLDEVSLSTVPLPASWTLMLIGLAAGFAFFHWRGRKDDGAFAAA